MERGKLDEELRRMSEIADRITPHSLLLCNESFASTNEREGSEIARQVVRAMLDKQIKVVFVTHMYELAHGFHAQAPRHERSSSVPQRARRRRTFKLARGRATAHQLRRRHLPARVRRAGETVVSPARHRAGRPGRPGTRRHLRVQTHERDHPRPRPPDPRQPRQPHRRGRHHARIRRVRPRRRSLGRVHGRARGRRAARRRRGLRRQGRADGGRQRQRRDRRRGPRPRRRRPESPRPRADRSRRHREQGAARRQRHPRRLDGRRARAGRRVPAAALALPRRRRRPAAGAR